MFSEPVGNVMERKKLLTAPPDTTVGEAAKLMARKKVGAVLVIGGKGELVGIFTERDAVFRVIAKGRDVRSTRLAQVMTPAPLTVHPRKSLGYALLLMYEHGFRHAPVVEDGRLLGIVSARSALDPDLEEFAAESRRREQIRREGEARP
jgi:CBS domain-containing protein